MMDFTGYLQAEIKLSLAKLILATVSYPPDGKQARANTHAWMRLDRSVRPPTPAAGPPMAFVIIPDILG